MLKTTAFSVFWMVILHSVSNTHGRLVPAQENQQVFAKGVESRSGNFQPADTSQHQNFGENNGGQSLNQNKHPSNTYHRGETLQFPSGDAYRAGNNRAYHKENGFTGFGPVSNGPVNNGALSNEGSYYGAGYNGATHIEVGDTRAGSNGVSNIGDSQNRAPNNVPNYGTGYNINGYNGAGNNEYQGIGSNSYYGIDRANGHYENPSQNSNSIQGASNSLYPGVVSYYPGYHYQTNNNIVENSEYPNDGNVYLNSNNQNQNIPPNIVIPQPNSVSQGGSIANENVGNRHIGGGNNFGNVENLPHPGNQQLPSNTIYVGNQRSENSLNGGNQHHNSGNNPNNVVNMGNWENGNQQQARIGNGNLYPQNANNGGSMKPQDGNFHLDSHAGNHHSESNHFSNSDSNPDEFPNHNEQFMKQIMLQAEHLCINANLQCQAHQECESMHCFENGVPRQEC